MPEETQTLEAPATQTTTQTNTAPGAGGTTTQTTQTHTPTTSDQPASEPSTSDIITKVTAKKPAPTPEQAAGTFKEFDDITDPTLRQKLIDRAKELQADYTRKTQAVAQERREIERARNERIAWTPQRIQQELMADPTFQAAAQTLMGQPQNPAGSGLTDQQFSMLTPQDQNRFLDMDRRISDIQQQNILSAISQKDQLLSSKYGDYDALRINDGIQSLARMTPPDVREHVYKALNHDDHVRAAYLQGKQDQANLNQQRTQGATSTFGTAMTPATDVPKKEKNETDVNYLTRLAMRRVDQAKQANSLRK